MRVSIVTPSFNNSSWLKLCVASVADQEIEHEHIIQDNCSTDGTLDWLVHDRRVTVNVEKDSGMYDAINRGLRKASGEILAYLNCDEQYLPGALKTIDATFKSHPEIDVIFANAVIVDGQGQYVCSRPVLIPWRSHIMVSQLPTFTCATFFRRSLVQQKNFLFDTQWRTISDATWVARLLENGVKVIALRRFTSIFTDRAENLGTGNTAQSERKALFNKAPAWARALKPAIVGAHRVRRFVSGAYFQKPFDYAIYSPKMPTTRTVHHVAHPTSVWHRRLGM